MQRYFINSNQIVDNKVYISGDDHHHIFKVMRMKISDKIIVCDENNSYLCRINNINNNEVICNIIEILHENKELPVKVSIAHGVVRREKMEEVIDKITQGGASFYIPVAMERSNVKFNDEKLERKMERMNKIAKESSEQSHRTKKLIVNQPITFKNLINLKSEYDLCLYAYEITSQDKSLKEILTTYKYQSILVLVGPEGGISDKEVIELNKAGFIPVSLGPRILRTEVAPTYIMNAISYQWEL